MPPSKLRKRFFDFMIRKDKENHYSSELFTGLKLDQSEFPRHLYGKSLSKHFPPYSSLTEKDQMLLEAGIEKFIAEKRFAFVKDFSHNKALAKLLISAAAVRLSFKSQADLFSDLKNIVIHQSFFLHDDTTGRALFGLAAKEVPTRDMVLETVPTCEVSLKKLVDMFGLIDKSEKAKPPGFEYDVGVTRTAMELAIEALDSLPKFENGEINGINLTDSQLLDLGSTLVNGTKALETLVCKHQAHLEALGQSVNLAELSQMKEDQIDHDALFAAVVLYTAPVLKDMESLWNTLIKSLSNGGGRGHSEVHFPYISLLSSLYYPRAGQDIGAHEFAHCIDFSLGLTAGKEPKPEHAAFFDKWDDAQMDYFDQKENADSSAYARAELFAELCSRFFSRPSLLKEEKPQFYEALFELFGYVPKEYPNCQWRLLRINFLNPSC